jgi:hypothetical protein
MRISSAVSSRSSSCLICFLSTRTSSTFTHESVPSSSSCVAYTFTESFWPNPASIVYSSAKVYSTFSARMMSPMLKASRRRLVSLTSSSVSSSKKMEYSGWDEDEVALVLREKEGEKETTVPG